MKKGTRNRVPFCEMLDQLKRRLDHDEGQRNDGDEARDSRTLSNFDRVSHSDTANDHHSASNRGGRTTESTGQEGQAAQECDD